MKEIYPYFRTLYLTELSNLGLISGYNRRSELIPILAKKSEDALRAFNVEDIFDPSEFAEQLFDELKEKNVFIENVQEFAGTYYRFSNDRLNEYIKSLKGNNRIAKEAGQFGKRYYPDVFDGYRVSGIPTATDHFILPRTQIASVDWRKVSAAIDSKTAQDIRERVAGLISTIEQSDLEPRLKSNAIRRAEAVADLLEAPDPPWEQIVELLNNRYFSAFLNALTIVQIIIGACS